MTLPNLEFKTLHDNGNILCFVGESHLNKELFRYFSQTRICEKIRYEDALSKDQQWINDRQFIVTTASIQFKKMVVDGLAHLNPTYFSLYSTQSHIGFNVSIGRGSLIHTFNTILDDVVIGNHVVITTHTMLGIDSIIKDFCHIGPYSQILISTTGEGCYLAARTSIVGTKANPTTVTDHCNFILGSAVTKSIDISGTYYGNRRINTDNSLITKID